MKFNISRFYAFVIFYYYSFYHILYKLLFRHKVIQTLIIFCYSINHFTITYRCKMAACTFYLCILRTSKL